MGDPKRGAILAATQPKFRHLYLMNHLFQALTVLVDEWRKARYECPEFPAIGEILDFALEDPATDQLRYLRQAQFRALETYWYLRLVLNTPRIPNLYAILFPKPKDRREAMGLRSVNETPKQDIC
jgi:type III restriction enzyme